MDVKKLINTNILEKIISMAIFVFILIKLREMTNLFLFTFIFSFLMYNAQNFLFIKIKKILPVERKVITVIIYILLASLIAFILYRYVPMIINELMAIIKQVASFDINNYKGKIDQRIINIAKEADIGKYIESISGNLMNVITNVGKTSIQVFFALMLSLFFLIEKDEITSFGKSLENSKVKGFYIVFKRFGINFLNSFGKVMQSQIIISFVNSIISTISLAVLGFPQVLGLGFMIFILGLIPVAGVWVSIIPLSIIGFKIGGMTKIIYVLVLIFVLHFIEGYFLNPKLMSMTTKLPIFFTFSILLISEHLMGIWGLLLGIPIFMFMLDILEVKKNNS